LFGKLANEVEVEDGTPVEECSLGERVDVDIAKLGTFGSINTYQKTSKIRPEHVTTFKESIPRSTTRNDLKHSVERKFNTKERQ
jgi:hypothetical protein